MKITGAITAIASPMNKDGSIDFSALDNLINFQIDNGISGIVAVGTTGESATIDFREHIKLITYFVQSVNGRVPLIAGTGANSTKEAIELTKAAKEEGANAALLVSPYYNKPSQEGLFLHHSKIADEVEIPQILYNVPSRTASFFESKTISRLAPHPNIIGHKDATGDLNILKELKNLCSKEIENNNFYLYSGDDATSYEFMKNGGHGTISVSSNIIPKLISEMSNFALNNNDKEGRSIHEKIYGLNKILFVESNPIPVKYALYLMGLSDIGIRLPLTVLDEKFRLDLKNELENLELI
ncbi:MAG: 4-hydroxy-tetrahydrodipicolinate synthase [Flavobacteriaceae bacterium]|jgi:4-hydroxy-tetrahydrodipicolinate synthase|nr:4-hydroxy-tetrahydrodipicolinate synthase [Flavobacteriaceae bacterium]|tara:strand:+ start:3823 stop:4716 length:894 start_codon:yes stop_codon:yes gene_type:complete